MEINENIANYLKEKESFDPLFISGDCLKVLKEIPEGTIDCVITSPPYWGHRLYSGGGIGQEKKYSHYIENITLITAEIYRIIKPSGSFWLNIGDTYRNKNLLGIPWRIAINLMDSQNWILRNSVIWNKHKGGLDSSKDKLRNMHENIFHFVKSAQDYYYDTSMIRSDARRGYCDSNGTQRRSKN